MKPYGEIVSSPFEINHTEKDLSEVVSMLKRLDDEVRIVMEATGGYHFPILTYFIEEDLYVCVINPLVMKKYASTVLRKGKTDKLDAIKIANYGIDNWYHLEKYKVNEEKYEQLRLLGRQYAHYMKLKIDSKLALTNILDRTMPKIKTLLKNRCDNPEMDKLNDFVEEYWHFDNITS